MKIITKTGTVYDAQGFIQALGVQVADHGNTISIGATEHLKDDLVITPGQIEGRAGWTVKFTPAEPGKSKREAEERDRLRLVNRALAAHREGYRFA